MEYSKIEYRVRPVTRFVVTRFYQGEESGGAVTGGCESRGEFDNHDTAFSVGYALARLEHELLGWPVGDERIIYPAAQSIEREPVTVAVA